MPLRDSNLPRQILARGLLAAMLAFALAPLAMRAQSGGSCAADCIKSWNSCISGCGEAKATLPQNPMTHDQLSKINTCVSTQCRPALGTCQTNCSKGKPKG